MTDYITFTPFLYNTLFFVTMNTDIWSSLPPEIQAAIEEANAVVHEEVAMGLWDMQNESALQFAMEQSNPRTHQSFRRGSRQVDCPCRTNSA